MARTWRSRPAAGSIRSADSGQSRATARLDDSAIVADALGIQAQAWAHRSWWGPGWYRSALSAAHQRAGARGHRVPAPPVLPSESPWLSWLGPWNGEFFVARTEGELVRAG